MNPTPGLTHVGKNQKKKLAFILICANVHCFIFLISVIAPRVLFFSSLDSIDKKFKFIYIHMVEIDTDPGKMMPIRLDPDLEYWNLLKLQHTFCNFKGTVLRDRFQKC